MCSRESLVPKLNNIDWYALIDTLLGDLKVEYELDTNGNHITIKAGRDHYQAIREQIEKAFHDLPSVLPYTVEVAPLAETHSQALLRFKALLGADRFADIAIDPDELFNIKKGAKIEAGVLYSKPTTNTRVISVWKDSVNALVADLGSHSRLQLKAMWNNEAAIGRDPLADQQSEINYHEVVKQNMGLHINANNEVTVFFNFRQLWQDLFVPELATKATVVSAPAIRVSYRHAELVIQKSHLLDYLRQELQSDVLWRTFKADASPVATPLYLDTSHTHQQMTKVSIVIDRSGSMGNIFDALTTNVLNFVKLLQPNAEVNILFFDNVIGPRKTFQAGDIKAITTFVKSLKPEGNTYLYKALKFEFSELLKSAKKGDSTAILLLTDGQDATPNSASAINDILAIQQSFKQSSIKVPKIFTVGIGNENSIQMLDSRLSSERLIINNLAEFDRVFKYIHEIQYPAVEHTLVVTQRPEQLSEYKITYQLDNNVQSPDIYLQFNQSAIGILGADHKQVIRLKEKLPDANIHDLVKAILAKTRDAMTAKPSGATKELATMKAHVVKLSIENQIPYEKANLERLADLMGDPQYESLEEVIQQKRYVERKATVPVFTMEYGAAVSILASSHFTGQMQLLPEPRYNIAGKLTSGVQEPIAQSTQSASLQTRINSDQNQMTVHAKDKVQVEQSRYYAECIPLVPDFNDTPLLYCQAEQFQSFVIPHERNFNNQGDHYNLNSCRPISYYGRPSITCEGEQTSVVFTPNSNARPFEDLNANLALGAVLVYWAKALYNRLTGKVVEEPKVFITDSREFKKKVNKLREMLNAAKLKIDAIKPFEDAHFYLSEIDDYYDDINALERKFTKGTLLEERFNAFYAEVKEFKEELFKDCEYLQEQRKHKFITPQFTLEQQRDWGQLIQHKSVTNVNDNLPRLQK